MSNTNPYAAPSFSPDASRLPLQVENGEIKNVKVEIGEVLDYSLKVWKDNLGLLIGVTLIFFLLSFGFSLFQGFVESLLMGNGQRPTPASLSFAMVFGLFSSAVQLFVGIGNLQLMLAMLRRQPTTLGMLFGGGGRFFASIGVSLLLGLAIVMGLLLLIIPGLIVILFYWPAYYLVIDRRTPVMQSFAVARTITKGNEVTTIVLGFVAVAITLIGLLALCVGLLAAQPLALLAFACAYLMMSGQIPTQPNE